MKTKILSILALLLMTVTQGAWAQETLTVFDVTDGDGSQWIPMCGYYFDYKYTKSECIIPASELTAMEGGTITAITFYARLVGGSNTTFGNAKQKVFLKEVSETTLGSSYSGMDNATVVFDGTLPMPTTGGYTISFSQGYTYNGGNLLIGVYNEAKGKDNRVWWYGDKNQSSGVSAFGYDMDSPANVPVSPQTFLPKTTFTYIPANVGRVIGLDGKYYKTKEAAVNAGTQACAIIAYVGSETGEAGYTGGLAIAMRDANGGTTVQWKNANGTADNPNQYNNIANALSAKESGSSLSSGRTNSTTWPAFYHALNNTITTSSGISASKPTSGTSGWFLPSIYQWNIILKALSGESNNLSESDNNNFKPAAVNVKIADADARLGSNNYLSSSEIDNSRPWYWYAGGGRAAGGLNKTHTATVRAVFAFNTLTAAEYTVTYDANGGSGAPDAQTKDGGIDLTLSSTVPTRTGYTFAGWNTKADGSGTSYSAGGSYTTNDDIVLYAQWFAGEGTQASPYEIASTTDWNNLVSAVNAGEAYSGNYFKMTANVGTVSTWMTGTFSGTFDGYGNTLTVGYSNTTADVKCAPFGTLNGATIQNLKVAGSISSNQRFIAGIAAWCSSTGNNVTNCLVSATINSSYSGNASDGGLVSLVDDGASLNVTGCAFAGKLLTTNGTTSCGGIVGWRRPSGTATITNCLYAPTSATGSETWIGSAEGENGNANFCRWNTSEPTITNCYYTTDFGSGSYTAQGLQARSIVKGDGVSTLSVTKGSGTTYNVAGITVYSNGVDYNSTFYGGSGQSVSLALTAATRTGYQFKQYAASQGTLSDETTDTPTLTMPAANSTANDVVTISAEYDPFSGGTGTSVNPYQIASTADWNVLVSNVNGGETYSDTYFQMTANISVTTRMSNTFSGTFDGDGNTLTVTYTASGDYTAPFGYMSGATVENLKVAGTISSSSGYRQASIGGRVANSTIRNCTSSVSFTLSQGEWVECGGLVAHLVDNTTLTMTGCAFTGSITYSNATGYAGGGLIGWLSNGCTGTLTDCVFAPSAVTFAKESGLRFYMFADIPSGDYTLNLTRCYYNDVAAAESKITVQGLQARSIAKGANVTTLAISGAGTEYDVSGITSYGTGIKYNNVLYAGSGDNVSLNITAPAGHVINTVSYTYEGGSETTMNPVNGVYSITMPDANVTINVTFVVVSREIAGYGNDDQDFTKWVFIASPVSGSVAVGNVGNLVNTDAPEEYNLYRFNQAADLEWENIKAVDNQGDSLHPDFKTLVNGHGYLYASKNNVTLMFMGPFNMKNDTTIALDYTTGNTDAGMRGWNLVGNPFPVRAYITDRSYYKISTDGTRVDPKEVSGACAIDSCSGVMVKANATGEIVTFSKTPAEQSTNNGNLHIALGQTVFDRAGVSTGSTTLDKAIVSFNEGSALGKFYFGNQNANIYIPQNGKDYAIASVSAGTDVARYVSTEVPVNFKANENGTYTISVNPEGVEMAYLHLIDNMTGSDVDLLALRQAQGPATYTFTAKTTDYESRFKLVFVANNDEDGSSTGSETFAFYSNGNWIIANDGDATLQVIDLNGRILSSETVNGSVSKSIHAAPGVYMIRLINGENVKVQKVVIE